MNKNKATVTYLVTEKVNVSELNQSIPFRNNAVFVAEGDRWVLFRVNHPSAH
jgi:hypothetical protein